MTTQRTASKAALALLWIVFIVSLSATTIQAQDQTMGLFVHDSSAFPGYTLFAPMGSQTTYLIDMGGRLVNSWPSLSRPALSVYLLENGNLLRTELNGNFVEGGAGGRIQQIAWDGTIVWDFEYSSNGRLQHHDIESLPNGNILILAWDTKTDAEAFAAGRDPARLTTPLISPEHIIEVEPTGPTTGNIVWEWHVWDHMIQDYDPAAANYGVVREHPELVDINYGNTHQDWIHANSVDYNPGLDQIIINSRGFDEFWIIDHSTTTAEAAGHTGGNSGKGGDILYRWGNPQAYRAGDEGDQQLNNQHDANWILPGLPGAGNILIFNNGSLEPGESSSADEIVPPVDANGHYPQPPAGIAYGPDDMAWTYDGSPHSFWYSGRLSGAQRLPNGNTLICFGPQSTFLEVTPDSQTVWQYRSPISNDLPRVQGSSSNTDQIFRCYRYAEGYPGFEGRDLTPGSALEIYPITISGTVHVPDFPTPHDSVIVMATITSGNSITVAEVYADLGAGFQPWTMFDDGNHHDGSAADGLYGVALSPVAGETTIPYYVHAEDNLGSSVNDPPNPPSTVYWFSVCCPMPQLFINELMAVNSACCQDEHGDFDAWIELYNHEEFDVDLTGMYLTNVIDDSTLFPIGDTIIPAKGHLLFWTDNETGEGTTHTNFVLNPSGGEIGLYSTDDTRRILIDSVTYTALATDNSYGRVADGAPAWTDFITPTPGAANSDCACLNQGDAEPDGFITALDLASCIDVLFAGAIDLQDPGCSSPRFDMDCDGFSTALDLGVLIDHLFAGGDGPCDPCAP